MSIGLRRIRGEEYKGEGDNHQGVGGDSDGKDESYVDKNIDNESDAIPLLSEGGLVEVGVDGVYEVGVDRGVDTSVDSDDIAAGIMFGDKVKETNDDEGFDNGVASVDEPHVNGSTKGNKVTTKRKK